MCLIAAVGYIVWAHHILGIWYYGIYLTPHHLSYTTLHMYTCQVWGLLITTHGIQVLIAQSTYLVLWYSVSLGTSTIHYYVVLSSGRCINTTYHTQLHYLVTLPSTNTSITYSPLPTYCTTYRYLVLPTRERALYYQSHHATYLVDTYTPS